MHVRLTFSPPAISGRLPYSVVSLSAIVTVLVSFTWVTTHAPARIEPPRMTASSNVRTLFPLPTVLTAPSATALPEASHVVLAGEDEIVADPIGVRLVTKGTPITLSPYTKTRPVTYQVAHEDVLVKQLQAPLHLVRRGETYIDEAGTYLEPVAPPQPGQLIEHGASEPTVVVGANGLIVVLPGDVYWVGPYTKARPAHYATAPEDLSVSDLSGRVSVVRKGEWYLDDITTYAEPYRLPPGAN